MPVLNFSSFRLNKTMLPAYQTFMGGNVVSVFDSDVERHVHNTTYACMRSPVSHKNFSFFWCCFGCHGRILILSDRRVPGEALTIEPLKVFTRKTMKTSVILLVEFWTNGIFSSFVLVPWQTNFRKW